MGNFSIALSGLQANTVALNTIGNNLANLNTTAYKGQSTSFEDLFYQQIGESGSGDAIQSGAGVKVSGTDTNFLQGTLLPTTDSADMALAGNGFFVVQQNGVQSLTRAGNFQLDSNGNLTTVDGEQVMGYGATNGVVNQSAGLQPLTIPVGANEAAQATGNIQVTANLDASATVGTTFSSPVQVFDSLGSSHQVTITYTKTGTNTWDYSVALPAGDATGAPSNNTGTLTFNSAGQLTSPAGSVANITFPGLTDGASNLSFNWDLNDSSGNPTVTQLASASSNNGTQQDGFASGVYQSFTVDPSGVITAQFSNGRTSTIGQVAVATVANTAGLTVTGNNNFTTTAASGLATVGVAGTGGRGTLTDDSLEQSNVDISTEFSNLIVAQRAFEANSKTVTTFDTVTQDTLALIR
ncbi:flagellar hook protein FlgE [Edaphobacter acidisoli]|uniref:Flagellar hook protein FlgE n=1 Tax=Edaphobacter acidisoli TaxID=2040573 RepID=A0A916VZU6_9BACT|nr:flagellar hook protein FlgE [Edaphobacter acidisoli]GGA56385.1 flagellar hook protein FlgE [Edaphobacter acidisoli]